MTPSFTSFASGNDVASSSTTRTWRPHRASRSGALSSTFNRPRSLAWLFAGDPSGGGEAQPRARTSSSSAASRTNTRLKLLVVEDDFLVGESLRLMLNELECDVVGPVPSIEAAEEMLREKEVDAAILDISLGHESSAPLAMQLRARSCPFVFVTGYANPGDLLPEELQDQVRFQKPIDRVQLQRILAALREN